MKQEILYNEEARNKIRDGVNKVANAVKVTLGAKGRNVIIDMSDEFYPHVTKDGVTVANSIYLTDAAENIGAKLIRQAASKTADDSGDGTSTTSLLTQEILLQGMESVSTHNPIELKKGMDLAVDEVIRYLKEKSIQVDSIERLTQVSTISANGDKELGSLVAEVTHKVGLDGLITVETSRGEETRYELEVGSKVLSGFTSPVYINNQKTGQAIYNDALVFLYEGILSTTEDLKPIFRELDIYTKQSNKPLQPLVIFCGGINGAAHQSIQFNRVNNGLEISTVAVSSMTREELLDILNDIQSVVGGKVVASSIGIALKDFKHEMFGKAEKTAIDSKQSILIGENKRLEERIVELRSLIELHKDDIIKRERLKARIARLNGGLATIYVGGTTEAEMRERKDRVDDAVGSTLAALKEGIVAGGGVALFRASRQLIGLKGKNADQQKGIEIICLSIHAPIEQILRNGGVDLKVLKDIAKKDFNIGYDVKNEEIVDMIESGIIDPLKVVRCALENSVSIAGLFLTTECIIYKKES